MKQRTRTFLIVGVCGVAMFCLAQSVSAQTRTSGDVSPDGGDRVASEAAIPLPPMGPEDFRQVLLTFVEMLDTLSAPSDGLYDRIAALNAEEMQALYDAYGGNHHIFAEAVGSLAVLISEGAEEGAGGAIPIGVPGILPPTECFLADYPAPGGLWFDLLGVLGLANDERCDPDFEAGLVTAMEVAKIAAIVAQAACDTLVVILGEGTNAPACVAAGIANGVAFAAEFILKQCHVDQARVDSAEIEAAYENSLLICEGLMCVEVDQARFGHGCDGEDDDCDGEIDECDEDQFGPVVFIDPAVRLTCYKDAAEAAEAVSLAVLAFDDCGPLTVGAPLVLGDECDVEVQVTATDDCGNATTVSTVVTIDADGPSITIDPTVADVCYSSIDEAEQAVLGAATIDDNCGSGDDLNITVHSSVTECNLRVRLDVTDKCGNTSTAAVTVRVDTHLPLVDIQRLLLGFRGEVLAFQTPVCYETVADAEAAVLAVTQFADNCTAAETVTKSVSSSGDPCSLAVTSEGVDECGNVNTDSVTVRVDAEIPVVTCSVAVDTMWPPNHMMTDVGFSYTATDNCTGEEELEVVVMVTSDEPTASADGAGQTTPAPDAAILRNLDGSIGGIQLRNERSTAGDGRVYQITVQVTDACGNVGIATCTVSVSPADGQPATDSGQYYDATQVN
ncbi:MAG: hypothetical protein JSV78_03370 [Phycisphaerales bacterium]|nr:MAG: hypothetical protein JSV78_03370 [Phycisphaerales bacterium]